MNNEAVVVIAAVTEWSLLALEVSEVGTIPQVIEGFATVEGPVAGVVAVAAAVAAVARSEEHTSELQSQ